MSTAQPNQYIQQWGRCPYCWQFYPVGTTHTCTGSNPYYIPEPACYKRKACGCKECAWSSSCENNKES